MNAEHLSAKEVADRQVFLTPLQASRHVRRMSMKRLNLIDVVGGIIFFVALFFISYWIMSW